MPVGVKIDGKDAHRSVRRLTATDRAVIKQMKAGLREAARLVRAEMHQRASAISRRLARRIKTKIDRFGTEARVINSYAGVWAIEKGRRPGAKMPPLKAVRGGYPAARLVSRRGLAARPFLKPTADAMAGQVKAVLSRVAREIEAQWRS